MSNEYYDAALGSGAEDSFMKSMLRHKLTVVKASTRQDYYQHWDYLVNEWRVDVKARKKIRRHDKGVADEYIYVELKNIGGGKGWVYGEAHLMAFERPDSFVLVWRSHLARLTEGLVTEVYTRRPSLYNRYKRASREKECVTLIRYQDLLTLPHKEFKK